MDPRWTTDRWRWRTGIFINTKLYAVHRYIVTCIYKLYYIISSIYIPDTEIYIHLSLCLSILFALDQLENSFLSVSMIDMNIGQNLNLYRLYQIVRIMHTRLQYRSSIVSHLFKTSLLRTGSHSYRCYIVHTYNVNIISMIQQVQY